jgi:PhoH-like ATPase
MGKNCKCVCIGDTNQVDSTHLNQMNNGLNWMVKKFKGHNHYAHIVLKGKESRGPICDLVLERKL